MVNINNILRSATDRLKHITVAILHWVVFLAADWLVQWEW